MESLKLPVLIYSLTTIDLILKYIFMTLIVKMKTQILRKLEGSISVYLFY